MVSGGARKGAGRPKGQGKHGEATKPVRIPLSMVQEISALVAYKGLRIPLYSSRVPAGLPAEADAHIEEYVNIYERLLPDPQHMGLAHASGDSMIDVGIFDGDLLLFNSREEPVHRSIVVARLNGEQTVKRLLITHGRYILMPENPLYAPISIEYGMEFSIVGVVKWWIRRP